MVKRKYAIGEVLLRKERILNQGESYSNGGFSMILLHTSGQWEARNYGWESGRILDAAIKKNEDIVHK